MGTRNNGRWETMDESNTDLSVIMRHFEVHNRTEGKADRTVGWYNEVLRLFYRWLAEQERPTTHGAIDEMVIREFILELQGRPGCKREAMSSHTIYNRVNALRAFFAWVHNLGYTDRCILAGLRQPRTAQLVIEPLTPEEISQVFSAINSDTALGSRNIAIVSLMLDSGLRLSEVAGLKERDAHIEDRYVKVMGKGSKERIVSFGLACQKTMLEYYHRFRAEPFHDGINSFFLTIDDYDMSA